MRLFGQTVVNYALIILCDFDLMSALTGILRKNDTLFTLKFTGICVIIKTIKVIDYKYEKTFKLLDYQAIIK